MLNVSQSIIDNKMPSLNVRSNADVIRLLMLVPMGKSNKKTKYGKEKV